jgi:signal transduction histidine kinase
MFKSIKTLFVMPITVLIIILALVVIGLSHHNSQHAVNSVSTQLHNEISQHINQHLHNFLETPHLLNALNSSLNTNTDNLIKHFHNQVEKSSVPYLFYGNVKGEFIGVQKMKDNTVLKIRNVDSPREIYELNPNGKRGIKLKQEIYDPRIRPWYKKASKERKATWSNIYVSKHRNVLQVTHVIPVYDDSNKLKGVFGANFILSDISKFLKTLQIGKTGQAFIMDDTGKLLASSIDTQLFVMGKKPKPLEAIHSHSPLIKSIALAIEKKWGNIRGFVNSEENATLHINEHTIQLSLHKDEHELQWIIVVTIPDSDFLGEIQANTFWTLLLSLIAVIIAIFIAVIVSGYVTRPVLKLNKHVKAMQKSHWTVWDKLAIDAQRKDEIGDLALSFSEVSQELAKSLDGLEQKVNDAVKELRQTNSSLKAFAHSVAHDLKVPVGEMYSFAEILKDVYRNKLDEQGQQSIDFIFNSGAKAVEIIDSLLMLAVTQREDVQLEILNMDEIIANVKNSVESMRVKHHASLLIPNDLPTAYGYQSWVEQIFTNYLTNAIKYGGTPPIIQVKAEIIGNHVRYSVTDNGSGMSTEDAAKIFGEATRLDQHRKIKGHGFGLSIVQQIVEKLEGECGVKIEIGKGSTFWFTLPMLSPNCKNCKFRANVNI